MAKWHEVERQKLELRRAELPLVDTEEAIASFDGLFEDAIANCPPRPTSGLVEQQAWFAKARK
jgi:hypothetical protein